jgi:transcriptional regulator with XRE-family HTH domain
LAELIQDRFPGLSVRKIAAQLGVEHTSVARWLSGSAGPTPSMDSCLRIARACEADPAEVFQLAGPKAQGFAELYSFYRMSPSSAADFHAREPLLSDLVQRLEKLFRRGMAGPLQRALSQLESTWEMRRTDFEFILDDCQAAAGCLIVDHPGLNGDIFYQWNVTPSATEQLCRGHKPAGWIGFAEEYYGLRLRFYLKDARSPDPDGIQSTLKLWAFGMQRSLNPAQHKKLESDAAPRIV